MPARRSAPAGLLAAPGGAAAVAAVAAVLLPGCAAAPEAAPAASAPTSGPATAASATASAPASNPASSPASNPASGPAATASPTASPPVEISVTIAAGTITPRPGNVPVARGSRVVLRVTSDRADDVHVHGYDRTVPLTPGRTATLEFSAERTGQFEVETHDSSRVLFQLLVR